MPSQGDTAHALARHVGGWVVGDPGITVTDVTHDSRAAGPGTAFVAVRGMTRDGHDFVHQTVAAGCDVVVVDHEMDVDVTQIVVGDTRAVLGPLAARVHGDPSSKLTLIGVTGTNGKTSVTHMIEAIGRAAGEVTGVIGTIGVRIGHTDVATERTTPEASDFQRILAAMVDGGVTIAAVEVSSHALALGRVGGATFSVGAFTNLSQDHLDFHADMDDYFAQKAKLFAVSETAIVCVDDEWGKKLARSIDDVVTVSATHNEAAITARVADMSIRGSIFVIEAEGNPVARVELPIAGSFSIANALVAAACCAPTTGWDAVVDGLRELPSIPGRFEVVSGDDEVVIVVDYSHTPAAVEAAIATARPLTPGRVLAVIGAGGDRDREKRPLMGRAASLADLVVITSDNPRSEPPAAIMDDVERGVTQASERIEDRRHAIRRAIEEARPGDTILVMGKGHEPYQEIAGVKHPFDDRAVAREELALVRGARS